MNTNSLQQLENLYIEHVHSNPELHSDSVRRGNPSVTDLKQDFQCWLGGIQSASRNPDLTNFIKNETNNITSNLDTIVTRVGDTLRSDKKQSNAA